MESIASHATNFADYWKKNAQEALSGAVCLKDHTVAYTHLWNVVSSALVLSKHSTARQISVPLSRAIALVDGTQIILDVTDLLNGKLTKCCWQDLAQRISFGIANLSTSLVWGMELGFYTLGTGLAASFSTLSAGACGMGFLIGSGDALWRLANLKEYDIEKQACIKKKALLDLIACTAAAALPALAISGAAISMTALTVLTLTASSFGMWSFLYEESPESVEGTFSKMVVSVFSESEGLEKFSKLVMKMAEGTNHIGLAGLAAAGQSFAEFHEPLHLIKRVKEWAVPEKGQYFHQKETSTVWKISNKVFLTTLAAAATAKFAIKYNLAQLKWLAQASIGAMPFLPVVILGSLALASATNVIDQALILKKNEKAKDQTKLKKWEAVAANLEKGKHQKIINTSRNNRLEKKKDGENKAAEVQGLSNKKYVMGKITRRQVRLRNSQNLQNKLVLGIICDSSKSVGVSLGLIGMTAAATPAIGAAASVFALSSTLLGMFSYCAGTVLKKNDPVPKFLDVAIG